MISASAPTDVSIGPCSQGSAASPRATATGYSAASRLSLSKGACVRVCLDIEGEGEGEGECGGEGGVGAGRLPSPPYKPRAPPNRCHFRLAYLLAHSSGFNVHVPQQKFTCNTHFTSGRLPTPHQLRTTCVAAKAHSLRGKGREKKEAKGRKGEGKRVGRVSSVRACVRVFRAGRESATENNVARASQ